MWIVRLALRRPYTFVVVAIVIAIVGLLAILHTPTDIFPNINIPVVSVLWSYQGLRPQEMADRVTTISERALTTTVNDIEHFESQSLNGTSVIKIFFQPGANISTAIAQLTSITSAQLRFMPPGITPPLIIQYNASSVPILQLSLSGSGMSEQQLFDYGTNFIRTQLVTIPGAGIPFPYGGKQRQIQVDLDTAALQAKSLSANDVVNAISNQNLILPSGTAKIGSSEYFVSLNGSPQTIEELNRLPVKQVGTTTIYVDDVAHVRDGFPPQTNVVRVDGQRSVLLSVIKTGSSSTLDIVAGIKNRLAQMKSSLPAALKITPLADQSLFVRAAISGVIREALIAACLTALMILIFLGSWRSTTIIAVSIPLSILTSIIVFSSLGETINIMTLGGLALAVGILVDDATVEIENINRNLDQGKEPQKAILDGAQQIAVPAFVSTLTICIVFVPMFFLTGVARYLFVPLAEAVSFAMLASYFLSRTLVPTMAKYMLRANEEQRMRQSAGRNPLVRWQAGFEKRFEDVRERYKKRLDWALDRRGAVLAGFLLAALVSLGLLFFIGQDFFPSVDTGHFTLHMRAPTGTRIEETAAICDRVEDEIRSEIPSRELTTIIDNIGLPYSTINLSYSNSAPVGPADADILVSLNEENHRPTATYVHDLRLNLAKKFPGITFYFLPADIVSQILNFGLPAPIDIQIVGQDKEGNRRFAAKLLDRLRSVPGATDLRIQQPFNYPDFRIDADRTKEQEIGYTQRDVAGNLLVSLSGSFQTAPSFWLDPRNGVTYAIATQTPQYRIESLKDLRSIPVSASGTPAQPEIFANLATVTRGSEMAVVSHYNITPVIDIFGAVSGRDLGGVSREISPIVDQSKKELPRGSRIVIRGQIETMRSSFIGLLAGLFFSIMLAYFLIVVNFQSWLDPFIIISALPTALAGIVWMLFITRTNVSVPALIGSIMCVGVATSNSILVVSFAKDRMGEGADAREAALDSGFTRFRPVIMTALAMIIGMVPMALSLGEGGEQNAPLGRAVIGGLVLATVATLFFVPCVFSLVHGRRSADGRTG